MENIDKLANIDAIANAIKNNSKDDFFFVPWIGRNYKEGLKGKKVLVVGASHYCNHTNICFCSHDNSDCKYLDNGSCGKGCKNFLDCTTSGKNRGNSKLYDDDCKWMKRDEEHSCLYNKLCYLIKKNSHDIIKKLSSTTLDEVCNFLDPNCEDNVSYTRFTNFCTRFFYKELTNEIEPKYNFWSHIAFVNYAQNFQPASTGNKFENSDFEAFKKYLEVLKPDIVIVWGCALGGELEKQEFKKEAKFYGYNWANKGIQFVNSYHPSYGGFEDNVRLEEALDKAFQEASKVTNG